MRLPRLLAILVLFVTAIASFALAAGGCGGDLPPDSMMQMQSTDGGATCSQRGTVMLDQACMTDCDCADTMVCPTGVYDRKTTPVCTYKCDATGSSAQCPMGCNTKGYCKLQ